MMQSYGQAPYPPPNQAPPAGYGPPPSQSSGPMVPQYAIPHPGKVSSSLARDTKTNTIVIFMAQKYVLIHVKWVLSPFKHISVLCSNDSIAAECVCCCTVKPRYVSGESEHWVDPHRTSTGVTILLSQSCHKWNRQ